MLTGTSVIGCGLAAAMSSVGAVVVVDGGRDGEVGRAEEEGTAG